MKKVITIVTNKYIVSLLVFATWMLFFDARDVLNTLEQKKKLYELDNKKQYYLSEIDKAQKALANLQNNPAALEKFARERYKMKKEGEDIFLIEEAPATEK